MNGWLLVEKHKHRIAKVPTAVADVQREVLAAKNIWAMYCPERGPDDLIYAAGWRWVADALERSTACPHDALIFGDRGVK